MEDISVAGNRKKTKDRLGVSGKDKFRLAKTILLFSLLTYLAIAGLYIFADRLLLSGPIKHVWSFSSQALFGIVNLLIGFYFGGKVSKG
jgi:hypothetical protein